MGNWFVKKHNLIFAALLVSSMVWGTEDAARSYKQGVAVYKSDPSAAVAFFERAAGEGHVGAMVGIATCYEQGYGTEIDYARALEWYEKAARQNSLKACEGLARIHASCPDPEFHDGAKAVKFAEAVAKKKPKDASATSLLAAAHARDFNFEQAWSLVVKAEPMARLASEKAAMSRMMILYGNGAPYPVTASESWLLKASDAQSVWAMERLVRRMSDHNDTLYDPAGAKNICGTAIKAGFSEFHIALGNSRMAEGDYESAFAQYVVPCEIWEKDGKKQTGLPGYPETRYRTSWGLSAEKAYEESLSRRESEGGVETVVRMNDGTTRSVSSLSGSGSGGRASSSYTCPRCEVDFNTYCQDCYSAKKMINMTRPVDMAGANFLLRVSAAKGDERAVEELAEIIELRKADLMVLLNEEGMGTNEWARALFTSADRCREDAGVPGNIDVADELCAKLYELKPTGDVAYLIGSMFYQHNHPPTRLEPFPSYRRTLDWLEVAHSSGYAPAVRRLAEVYASNQAYQPCYADSAVQYAKAWFERCEADDADALVLLACAYGRSGEFNRARDYMEKAITAMEKKGVDIPPHYPRVLKGFNRERWSSGAFDRGVSPLLMDSVLGK